MRTFAIMQTRGAEYRAYWQGEVSKMDNPELRAGAEARSAKVAERFDSIRTKFSAARAAYQPFVKECTDIESYLSKELSTTSVSVSAGAIDKAIANGNALSKSIDDVIVELISVSVKMSPEAK